MKLYEIKEMTSDEIAKRIEEEEKNLVDLKILIMNLNNLTNTGKLSLAKKDIARMKTVLSERQRAEKLAQTDKKEGAKA